MKNILILILFLTLNSCIDKSVKSHEIVSKHPVTKSSMDSTTFYDTIIIDYTIENAIRDKRNLMFAELSQQVLLDSLRKLCKLPDVTDINENKLPFDDYRNIYKYYFNSIPKSIYVRIFPNEEIVYLSTVENSVKVNENSKEVVLQKGTKISEEREYKTLLSLIEKENYIQLLFTKQGKYTPDVVLVTVANNDFSFIDSFHLYGGIYDSYDIDYWHSKFINDYNEIIFTRVRNLRLDSIELDTAIQRINIEPDGNILD